jgi:hypothetical protein
VFDVVFIYSRKSPHPCHSLQQLIRLEENSELNVTFLAQLAKGNVSFCHHLASGVRRPLTFHILIFSSETTWQIETEHGMNVH